MMTWTTLVVLALVVMQTITDAQSTITSSPPPTQSPVPSPIRLDSMALHDPSPSPTSAHPATLPTSPTVDAMRLPWFGPTNINVGMDPTKSFEGSSSSADMPSPPTPTVPKLTPQPPVSTIPPVTSTNPPSPSPSPSTVHPEPTPGTTSPTVVTPVVPSISPTLSPTLNPQVDVLPINTTPKPSQPTPTTAKSDENQQPKNSSIDPTLESKTLIQPEDQDRKSPEDPPQHSSVLINDVPGSAPADSNEVSKNLTNHGPTSKSSADGQVAIVLGIVAGCGVILGVLLAIEMYLRRSRRRHLRSGELERPIIII